MARLTDPEKLRCYKCALANRKVNGYILFTRRAAEWLREELDGTTQFEFTELLHDYVNAGGEIDEVVERRPEWAMHSHHYDLRPIVAGRRRYVETRLIYKDANDPDDPIIHVVNIHDA